MSLPLLNGVPFLGGITLIQNGRFFDGSAAAPSITFATNPTTGFFYYAPGVFGFTSSGFFSMAFAGGGRIYGTQGTNYIEAGTSGSITLLAAGTNQNITLKPSGTGTNSIASSFAKATAATNYAAIFTSNDAASDALVLYLGFTGNAVAASRRVLLDAYDNNVGVCPLVINASGSSVLIGTTTDSANGKLQLATHTTSAGGIGFGTDTSLHRTASAGMIAINHIGGSVPGLALYENGAVKASFFTSNGPAYLQTDSANALFLRTNNSYAFAIDNAQNCWFTTGKCGFGIGAAGSLTEGAVSSEVRLLKRVTAIANAAATAVLTVTIPNAAHGATLHLQLQGMLGAGGAVGAYEACGTTEYDVAIARTAGVATVAAISAAGGTANANVAGAATITVTAALSAISGAVGATQTFTVNVTITRGSGASSNHVCLLRAELMNANATGVTMA